MPETNLDAAAQIELTNRMDEFTAAYHADAGVRARAEAEPRAVLVEYGLDALAPPGADVRIVANTGDTSHVMLPPDPNAEMSDEALTNIAGGFGTACAHAHDPSCYVAAGSCADGTSSGMTSRRIGYNP